MGYHRIAANIVIAAFDFQSATMTIDAPIDHTVDTASACQWRTGRFHDHVNCQSPNLRSSLRMVVLGKPQRTRAFRPYALSGVRP
jgi:hypothetical protein